MTDGMSPALKSMNKALKLVLESFESVQTVSGRAIDKGAIVQARLELNKVDQVLDEIARDEQKITANGAGVSSMLGGLASKVIALGSAYLGMNMVRKAIDYASDLTEVQNVVDVTFKNSASEVDAWAKTTLDAYGLNELSAKRYVGTMGAMLKSTGISGDAVVDMSEKIVGLAGDMASFYNLNAEDAFTKIRSGISGETEPLKQLGINMSVANLEAYALSQGITKAYSKMSQAEQVQLRYNYLLQATADAQGDFARTSDSFANQLKLIKENWNSLTGELATYALPVLTAGLHELNNIISWVGQNLDIVLPIVGAVAGAFLTYSAVAFALKLPLMLATVQQWALNSAIFACPVFWIVAGFIALVAIIFASASAIAKFTGVANSGLGVIVGAVYAVGAVFQNLWMLIKTIAGYIWEQMKLTADNMSIAFSNAINGIQGFFYNLLSTAMTVISKIAEQLSKLPFVEFDAKGLSDKAQEYADKAQEKQASMQSYADRDPSKVWKEQWDKQDWKDISHEFYKGQIKGDIWSNNISNALQDYVGGGAGAVMDVLDETAMNTASTADSAGKTANAVSATTEELKYLKDIAERDAINRFTTAEIKVDMQNTNNISSGMDIDVIVSRLYDGISEAMENMAEGAYA